MKTLRKYFNKQSVDNRVIVQEELGGFGGEFIQEHVTRIQNPEVRESLKHMSVLEVIH